MKITGVITEYNPFHNGHLYHLEESRRITRADYLITVMSGNFLQRGGPAILNKYERARMALMHGADLVLELPSIYATASAELFAFGSVSLLHALGAVTDLVFGSESSDLQLLLSAAQLLAAEPQDFQHALNRHLKEGCSFPRARQLAVSEQFPAIGDEFFSLPNNILGIEYLKALIRLGSPITPHTVKRLGNGYHDRKFTKNSFASASGIRQAIHLGEALDMLKDYVPGDVLSILKEQKGKRFPINESDFSSLLHYKLLLSRNVYASFADISPELERRMQHLLPQYRDISSFTDLLKTKNYTRTRISRCLTHLLLELRTEDLLMAQNAAFPVPYARILGFRKDAALLLTALGQHTCIPLITKVADAKKSLQKWYEDDPAALPMAERLFSLDLLAADVYETAVCSKYGSTPVNEYTHPMVIL